MYMLLFRFAAVLALAAWVTSCAQARSPMIAPAASSTIQSEARGACAETTPHAAMLRYPDVGPTHIVFLHADDRWIVPPERGMASPLASPACGIEGHGVDPDIRVVDDPALMVDARDPQLDAAIEHMLSELRRKPYVTPKRPAYPDRSGMGIREQDK